MQKIQFDKENKEIVIGKLQFYLHEELDFDIGSFDADFLLDFICDELGPYFFNQGLSVARLVVQEHIQTIEDRLYENEIPLSDILSTSAKK